MNSHKGTHERRALRKDRTHASTLTPCRRIGIAPPIDPLELQAGPSAFRTLQPSGITFESHSSMMSRTLIRAIARDRRSTND